MMDFLLSCGPFGYILAALTVLFFASLPGAWRHAYRRQVPFLLGTAAAATGFLGQTTAIYRSLTQVIPADELNPEMISAGLRESFNSTWWGSGLLLLGTAVWLFITVLQRSREAK